MATTSSVYKFRKNVTIGALSAEEDTKFLSECFVDTGVLECLLDMADVRTVVLGRTGSGKSALFYELAKRASSIVISPEELALDYLSNSAILNQLHDCGVSLTPLYKLLWKHVFLVETLRWRHQQLTESANARGFWQTLLNGFAKTPKDQTSQAALQYLSDFGDQFWQTTDYRIQEIVEKANQQIEAGVSAQIKALNFSVGGKKDAGEERKTLVEQIGREFVASIQIKKLNDAIKWLATDMEGQPNLFIIVDGLDGAWAATELRYQLIRALIETTREFRHVQKVKIIVALREDLLEAIIDASSEPGAQREKLMQLCIRLNWNKDELKEVVETRVNKLVRDAYTTARVKIDDIMEPNARSPGVQYLLERTLLRPRDIIDFFNHCIMQTTENPKITRHMVLAAEPSYSTGRLQAISDEWRSVEPLVHESAQFLSGRKANFRIGDLTDEEIHQHCQELYIRHWHLESAIAKSAKLHCENPAEMSATDFMHSLLALFYQVGLVGLKLNPAEKYCWSTQDRPTVSASELHENVGVRVQKTFWRALNIIGDKGEGE